MQFSCPNDPNSGVVIVRALSKRLMTSRLNLEDIAQLAGVSRATVSRVVNDMPNVSPTTRQRVWQVIQEHDYQPNLAARALVTRQTKVLSLVIPQSVTSTFADPYFPILIEGITARAQQHDYAIMLWIGNELDRDRFGKRILANDLCDGVIITSALVDDQLLDQLEQAGFPYMVVGKPGDLAHMNYVDVDNIHGAQLAVTHLLRVGRQRIGTITGPLNKVAAQDRLTGYRRALEASGLSMDPALVVEGDFTEEAGYTGWQTLSQQGVDAVFAASDLTALGVLAALQDSGCCVPADVSLVGFDDFAAASMCRPALTTIRQPVAQVGNIATKALLDLLNGTLQVPYQVVLPVELVIRESCGAVLHG